MEIDAKKTAFAEHLLTELPVRHLPRPTDLSGSCQVQRPPFEPKFGPQKRPAANGLATMNRGEQAAAALEASLTTLESKLDAMLEALEDKADASSPAADAKAPATDAKIEDKAQANTSGNEKPAGHGSSKTAE